MSPTKKVMVLLVQSLKGVTKKTGVVDSDDTQTTIGHLDGAHEEWFE